MTENQPQPPESEQPQPETPAPPPSDAPPAQPLSPQKPSAIKTLTITTLRGTIQLLEKAVEKLEAPPPAELQPSLLDKMRPGLINIWNAWVVVLGRIRALLPESVSQKLSNWGLTGAIAGILALVVWTTSNFLIEKPVDVTTTPPSGVPTPPELTAPAEPAPVEPIPAVLTPEQRLIASIQEQIVEVTTQYADGLIQSIQANFPGSYLIVKIGNEWYDLNNSQQNKLASQILQRAKELDFSKLDLIDLQGNLVARNAVIGSEMIILSRSLKIEEG